MSMESRAFQVAQRVGGGTRCGSWSPAEEICENVLFTFVRRRFELRQNVKCGRYIPDFSIWSKRGPVAAIEIDGKQFHDAVVDRDRDEVLLRYGLCPGGVVFRIPAGAALCEPRIVPLFVNACGFSFFVFRRSWRVLFRAEEVSSWEYWPTRGWYELYATIIPHVWRGSLPLIARRNGDAA